MKRLLIIPLLVGVLQAQTFEVFLQNAIEQSPYLQANRLQLKQADAKASLTTRYKNPSLELEVSNFAINNVGNKSGFRAGLVQPVRLWGVSNDRNILAKAQKKEVQNLVTLSRADFIAQLSSLYSAYKRTVRIEALVQKELEISQEILTISKERFEGGTIARVKYLQAKVDMQRVKSSQNRAEVNRVSAYYKLLAFSGLHEEVAVDTNYDFSLNPDMEGMRSAELAYTKSKAASSLALAQLNTNQLEWIDVYGAFEKEPDQGIARVGVSIPLVIFNRKTQEKKIAQLQAKKSQLLAKNIGTRTKMKLKSLHESVLSLEKLSVNTDKLLKSQEELVSMYEDGYKIANIDLIELQMVKTQLIQTQADAIEIGFSKEQNIIQHNFLVGEYNE